jgi:hypothetical protein
MSNTIKIIHGCDHIIKEKWTNRLERDVARGNKNFDTIEGVEVESVFYAETIERIEVGDGVNHIKQSRPGFTTPWIKDFQYPTGSDSESLSEPLDTPMTVATGSDCKSGFLRGILQGVSFLNLFGFLGMDGPGGPDLTISNCTLNKLRRSGESDYFLSYSSVIENIEGPQGKNFSVRSTISRESYYKAARLFVSIPVTPVFSAPPPNQDPESLTVKIVVGTVSGGFVAPEAGANHQVTVQKVDLMTPSLVLTQYNLFGIYNIPLPTSINDNIFIEVNFESSAASPSRYLIGVPEFEEMESFDRPSMVYTPKAIDLLVAGLPDMDAVMLSKIVGEGVFHSSKSGIDSWLSNADVAPYVLKSGPLSVKHMLPNLTEMGMYRYLHQKFFFIDAPMKRGIEYTIKAPSFLSIIPIIDSMVFYNFPSSPFFRIDEDAQRNKLIAPYRHTPMIDYVGVFISGPQESMLEFESISIYETGHPEPQELSPSNFTVPGFQVVSGEPRMCLTVNTGETFNPARRPELVGLKALPDGTRDTIDLFTGDIIERVGSFSLRGIYADLRLNEYMQDLEGSKSPVLSIDRASSPNHDFIVVEAPRDMAVISDSAGLKNIIMIPSCYEVYDYLSMPPTTGFFFYLSHVDQTIRIGFPKSVITGEMMGLNFLTMIYSIIYKLKEPVEHTTHRMFFQDKDFLVIGGNKIKWLNQSSKFPTGGKKYKLIFDSSHVEMRNYGEDTCPRCNGNGWFVSTTPGDSKELINAKGVDKMVQDYLKILLTDSRYSSPGTAFLSLKGMVKPREILSSLIEMYIREAESLLKSQQYELSVLGSEVPSSETLKAVIIKYIDITSSQDRIYIEIDLINGERFEAVIGLQI